MTKHMLSWNNTPAKQAILDFVSRVTQEASPDWLAPVERVAVFDNDGTLWCEKPIQIQLNMILRRLAVMAEKDPSLRKKQPWQAAYEKNFGWFNDVVVKHYNGDDSGVKVFAGGVLKAYGDDMNVETFAAEVVDFMHQVQHPTFKRLYMELTFKPMVELVHYLKAKDFTTYIVSGGGRDFMRPVTQTLYGIPPERVIGSSVTVSYKEDAQGANIVRQEGIDIFDDGPEKPVQIWNRIGRRPILAGGNANGDIPMLKYTSQQDRPSLCLLVNHDDTKREFDYSAGAEKALKVAKENSWTIISVKDDWNRVFSFDLPS